MYSLNIISLLSILTVVCIQLTYNMANDKHCISMSSWNIGCRFNCAGPYLHELLNMSDIIVLNEHGLYDCELYKLDHIHPNFTSMGKASHRLNDIDHGKKMGHGGCAILWHQSLNCCIEPMPNIGSDRICVVKLKTKSKEVYIIGTYLPYDGCQIANFSDQIEILGNILTNELNGKNVILMGDWNCQFGTDYIIHGFSRARGKSYRNSRLMFDVITRCDMNVVDMGDMGSGPTYTFFAQRAGTFIKSYIDHCAVSVDLLNDVELCEVLDDHVENISDHLPINLRVRIDDGYHIYGENNNQQVGWYKATPEEIKQLYTIPLDEKVDEWMIRNNISFDDVSICNGNNINDFVHELCNIVGNTSDNLPQVKFSKALKPYWTETLSKLSKENKKARSDWVRAGRPRDHENTYYIEYKDAKRKFRKEIRKCTYLYEKECMDEINKSNELDQKFFWYTVNKKRKKTRKINPIKNDHGVLLTNVEDIRNEWQNYYQKLYSKSQSSQVDTQLVADIQNELHTALTQSLIHESLEGGHVTSDEVYRLVHKMKRRKAPGWDKITSEHLKYCGDKTLHAVTWLMNCIIQTETVPNDLKRGLIAPIPKQNKDVTQKDNNRGIMLLPIFYKLFESILLEREKEWLSNTEVVDELQGAGQDHCSCLHVSMLLQESIAHHANKGQNVYIALLDIRKAFDTVWVEGLLYKLLRAGMNHKSLRLVANAYDNFECSVIIDGQWNSWFTAERGVHQGALLSMRIYQVFINELLQQLRQSRHGSVLFGIEATCPSYADDITTVTLYKQSLNSLLGIAHNYSLKWLFDFNITKSGWMLWGKDEYPELDVCLGGQPLQRFNSTKHMGIMLCSGNKEIISSYSQRIAKARSVVLCSKGIGSNIIPVNPPVMSKIYWSVAIPRMLYGMEVVPISDAGLVELEKAHRQNCKIIQGVPSNTPNPAPLATLGWLSLTGYIDIMKLCFMWRLLCMNGNNIFKRLMICVLKIVLENGIPHQKMKSPIICMYETAVKYGLENVLRQAVIFNILPDFESIKCHTKSIVRELENNRWKASCILYKELEYYRCTVSGIKMHPWWLFAKDEPLYCKKVAGVVAILMGTQPVNYQRNFDRSDCKLCGSFELETVEHILFKCNALDVYRGSLWENILSRLPEPLKQSVMLMSYRERTIFFISCMHNSYTQEWREIYKAIANFIYMMYVYRAMLYDNTT